MKDNSGDHTGLTAAEVSKFKALLLAKRKELLGDVLSMEDKTLGRQGSDLSNMPTHMADMGSDNYETEHALRLVGTERKLLKDIDDALDRIEIGTYGICEGSGKSIPKTRLKAIPWVKYCVEYASMLEKGLAKKNILSPATNYDYWVDEQDDEPKDTFRRSKE